MRDMLYIVIVMLVVFILLTAYFYARYRLLCRAIKKADKDLKSIIKNIDENQIIKQEEPNKELENLLATINDSLKAIRSERIIYEKREKEFQKQIENISHDLRTPLTSILGYLKILDQSGLEQEDKEALAIIQRKAYLLQRLISQFYDFSRLTSEDYVLEMEQIDIARLLRETVIDYYQELSVKNLEIDLVIPEHPILVEANSNAMERVFLNLLQNACRYAESRLKIGIEQSKDEVTVSFENNVTDFSEDDLNSIFERFYMRDNARSDGASGLGLTIAKHLVEKMHGMLEAELKDEKWLRLKIKLVNIENI
ncbi:sensor histidine kinase [Clostridium sp. Marseille-P299]|uniref:sensor histidine kinase n=1 Tax=Clostridium sp. Marseille-P299 TaxID=1805477 RepID=UPI0008334D89|nr:HAMP domain-containing sensor histidine kinase [Clostridium sp. Marseille-P299]